MISENLDYLPLALEGQIVYPVESLVVNHFRGEEQQTSDFHMQIAELILAVPINQLLLNLDPAVEKLNLKSIVETFNLF